ncbi:MAG: GMC oxidoreductase, partial [Pseudomonadota bacterium]
PKISEFNTGDNFGNAYFQMNQRSGRRWSAARAFLDPASQRNNLTVITEAHTLNVITTPTAEGRRATGVTVQTRQGQQVFHANNEVVLATGAIGSPHLLQLSGIGPGELLRQHGITVHHDLPGVGGNLHDHLQIRTIYKVSNTVTLNQRAGSLWGKAMMGLEYFIRRTGPLTMPPSQLGAFAKSDPDQPTANIEWHVQPLSLDKFGEPLHPYNAVTPSVCNLRPSSRGYVHMRTPDPLAAPEIKLNYLSSEQDLDVAVRSLKFTRRIMQADALAPFQPEELKPGPNVVTDAQLADAARDLGTTIFHPVGTCKMGSDVNAVVNDRLQVHGISHLRVIDASIMPQITSGNTNAPTVMIAEQGADFIKQDYQHAH